MHCKFTVMYSHFQGHSFNISGTNFSTKKQLLPVAWTNRITTRHYCDTVHTTDSTYACNGYIYYYTQKTSLFGKLGPLIWTWLWLQWYLLHSKMSDDIKLKNCIGGYLLCFKCLKISELGKDTLFLLNYSLLKLWQLSNCMHFVTFTICICRAMALTSSLL